MSNRIAIIKKVHNCKIDVCPDKGKTLYTIKLDDRKIVLSESEFKNLIKEVK
jgi:hypothetical protein